jgi:hypothetical protein
MAFWALLNCIARFLKHLFKQHKQGYKIFLPTGASRLSCLDAALCRGDPCVGSAPVREAEFMNKFANSLSDAENATHL